MNRDPVTPQPRNRFDSETCAAHGAGASTIPPGRPPRRLPHRDADRQAAGAVGQIIASHLNSSRGRKPGWGTLEISLSLPRKLLDPYSCCVGLPRGGRLRFAGGRYNGAAGASSRAVDSLTDQSDAGRPPAGQRRRAGRRRGGQPRCASRTRRSPARCAGSCPGRGACSRPLRRRGEAGRS